ncbi:MAG: Rossmann-like domain-containing protein [Candidatus Methylumidiphilus sp.]
MSNPYEIYDLLQDYAAGVETVRDIVIGLVWTYCEAEAVGLAMSPGNPTRTLPWSGNLRGKPVAELAAWVREFEPYKATVGMAAVNAAINHRHELPAGLSLEPGVSGNLAVFDYFLPQIKDKKIIVIGRYPGLDTFVDAHGLNLTVLERQPGQGDWPDTACEYLLPEAEWVFLTASSIPNKTFPRLAELSTHATTVLMGPTTPWLPDLHHFGIDYLAGVEITDPNSAKATVSEGGGVRLFDQAVRYRVAALGVAEAADWSKQLIAQTAAAKEALTRAMDAWYERGETRRFPRYAELETTNRRLSRLDTCYKRLWDTIHHE